MNDLYTPTTDKGWRYKNMAYWFATGWWFAQVRTEFIPDHSTDFSYWVARKADDYENSDTTGVHSLASIPDLWKEFRDSLDD